MTGVFQPNVFQPDVFQEEVVETPPAPSPYPWEINPLNMNVGF
jgi:hypothetical protein